jgi:hypothetical protein
MTNRSESLPDKATLVHEILSRLARELAALETSAQAAHQAATHDESRAEDAHDTRGLEASYLAGAQAARATDLRIRITRLRAMPTRAWVDGEPIAPGALLLLAQAGRRSAYFLLPIGGVPTVECGGQTVHAITPESPLGDALIGQRPGDSIEVESQGGTREYEILACV